MKKSEDAAHATRSAQHTALDNQSLLSPSDEAIHLDHVSFTYADASSPALQDVSLRVRSGEMVVIIGASGAGKSTLMKCLNRVIPAFQSGQLSGQVRLFEIG